MIRIKNQNYTPPRLPAEYEEVEYIESTGTQYIDTGVLTAQDIELDLKFSTGVTQRCCMGARYSTSSSSLVWGYPEIGKAYVGFGGATTPYNTTPATLYDRTMHNVILSSSKYTIDGISQTISNRGTLSRFYNILLFTWSNAGVPDERMWVGNVYEFKIKKNDVLIRNFIPCYRKSDNVTGLYDLVNNQFYTNAGTGTFLRGAEVGPKEYVNLRPKIGNKNVISRYVGNDLIYGGDLKQKVNYTMLYDYGDECEELTGGWQNKILIKDGNSGTVSKTFTKNDDNLYRKISTSTTQYVSQDHGVVGNNKIDITGYSMLSAVMSGYGSVSSYNGGDYAEMALGTAVILWNGTAHFRGDHEAVGIEFNSIKHLGAKKTGSYTINKGLYSFDISQFNGEWYAGVGQGISWAKANKYIYLYACILLKQDFWQPLASLAGISASSIADILTNSSTLLNNENAVKYMISHCTGDFMASAVANQTFLTALNNSPYKTIIQGNEHWNKFLSMVA